MKPSDIDEMAFDYLEGNLLPEEKDAFELLMAESEITHHQVKLWKSTYFNEELPMVGDLEKKLLKYDSRSFASEIIRKIFGVVLMLFPVVFLTVNTQPAQVNTIAELTANMPTVNDAPSQCSDIPKAQIIEPMRDEISQVEITRQPVVPEPSLKFEFTQENSDLLKISAEEQVVLEDFKIVRTNSIPVKSSIRKLSGKEIRSLNKRKRREHQRQTEMKFMKGNEPYVVPLKSSNF
jgi:hypothetical protein